MRKVRNKAAGTIGEVPLLYDRVSGRFDSSGGGSNGGNPQHPCNPGPIDFKVAASKYSGN